MATNKNFEVKNGLTVAGTERITSAGAFTGSLASATTATTQSATDNSTKIATTAYTDAAITAVIGGAPGTLDTLNELAAAINDDASYASTLTTALATKLPLAGGTLTGGLTINNGHVNIDSGLSYQWGNSHERIEQSDGKIEFFTNNGEQMTLSGSSLGIGTTSPSVPLDVAGNTFVNSGNGGGVALKIGGEGGNGLKTQYVLASGHTNFQIGVATHAASVFSITPSTAAGNTTFTNAALNINASGNVGIGTASPAGLLHVDSSAKTEILLEGTQTSNGEIVDISFRNASDSVAAIQVLRVSNNDQADMAFFTQPNSGSVTERMRIDSSGNVGIGNTAPSAHHPDFRSIQLGAGGSGISGGATGNRNINLSNNAYLASGGSWKYVAADHAANIEMYDGTMHFKVAPSGSANATVSWNEAMTILNSGRVGIGTSSVGAKLEISGKDDEGATDLLRLQFDNSPADTGITFTDINSTVKNRITMDASNTSDLHISASTEMKFFLGTTGTSTTQVMHLKKVNSSVSCVHAGYGVIGPSADITVRAQGHGENWRWGSNITNSNSYWLNSANVGMYMSTGHNYWTAHSDERLKENITPLGEVLPSLKNMRCVKFNRKGSEITQIGFIAQDWEGKGFDEVVDEDTGFTIQDDGTLKSVVEEDNTSTSKPKSLAYTETIPLLLKAIQELEARITTLEG